MTLLKFASAQVLEARMARQGSGLMRDAHKHTFNYEPRPGFLYVRSRAISSRTNDNFDHFPAEEIKGAYRTFIGKPVFVNHHNDNHRRARGVIIDAALHEDSNPDGSPDTWVEVLMEVDAVRFPKLAQAIVAGHIDRTSMGTDVAFSICSVCNNKASTPLEYCQHIPRLKGKKVRRRTASGGAEDVLVYEKCYGLGFFENSLLVEEPADPTAYFLGVDARGVEGMVVAKTASKTALNETLAPAKVDTLREEACPVCGEADTYDGDKCRVCGFIRPPAEFMDPDLEKARKVDLRQDKAEVAEQQAVPAQDGPADAHAPQAAPLQDGTPAPDYLKRAIPKSDPTAGAEPGATGGTPLWQQKERPKDPAGGAPSGAPGEDAAAGEPLWKQRTRRKSAGLDTQKEKSMRPALAALAEQQQKIDRLETAVTAIASLAGLDNHPAVTALRTTAADENPAQPSGWANPGGAGSEAPKATTEEASTPAATDDPTTSGATPATDVSPAATTSLDSTETVLDEPLDLNEQDPTKQVAGTDDLGEGARGNAGSGRTETEVRVGDPNNPDAAFTETGWKSSSKEPSEGRQIAAMRLARLRMQAGIADQGTDDLALGSTIASGEMSDEAIQTEIDTLAKVVQASAQRQPVAANRSLVPQRTASVEPGSGVTRTMPSMVTDPAVPVQKVAHGPRDDEFAFE